MEYDMKENGLKAGSELLNRLQNIETDMLVDIDEFCRVHDIQYSLAYGTALGAVRHHGPIPWDDDVDICMTRKEYEKFIKAWNENPKKGYYLQRCGYDTNSKINHSKIRKDGTVWASEEEVKSNEHTGVWVDVFVWDKVPDNKIIRMYMQLYGILNLVYTRDYPYDRGGKGLKILSQILLLLPKKMKQAIRKKAETIIKKYKHRRKNYSYLCFAAPSSLKQYFPGKTFENCVKIDYSGHMLSITDNVDDVLKIIYGNYMELPPEEKRICGHMPEVIDI